MNKSNQESRTWAMLLHLSYFVGYVIPFAGWIAPVLIWQLKKDDFPELDAHGKVVINWMISALIYGAVCGLLFFVLIGIPLLIALGILTIVFPIIGAIKANEGEVWPYPMSITFFR